MPIAEKNHGVFNRISQDQTDNAQRMIAPIEFAIVESREIGICIVLNAFFGELETLSSIILSKCRQVEKIFELSLRRDGHVMLITQRQNKTGSFRLLLQLQ